MQKTKTTVKIAGRDYNISGTDSPEYVRRVAAYVDRKMGEISLAARLQPIDLAVLTAVNCADDMMKSRDEIRFLKQRIAELEGNKDA